MGVTSTVRNSVTCGAVKALATIAAAAEWARERNEGNLAAARAYQAGEGPFQSRAAQTLLAGAFLTDFYALVARWSEWATGVVESWPDDPAEARVDPAVFVEFVSPASWGGPDDRGPTERRPGL